MGANNRDFLICSSENDAALRIIILTVLAENPELKQGNFARLCEMDEGSFSIWLHPKTGNRGATTEPNSPAKSGLPTLPRNRYIALVLAGLDEGWLPAAGNVLRRALAGFLRSSQADVKRARVILEGDYRFQRLSYKARSYVLVGALHIDRNLETAENSRIQAGINNLEADAWYPRTGTIVPRGSGSYVMVSNKVDYPAELQVAHLQATGNPVSVMHGPFEDWHETAHYLGRIWIERVPHPVPREQIRAVPRTSVDAALLRYLHGEGEDPIVVLR